MTGDGKPARVAVVGAGVSGLAAAVRLRDLAAAANRPTAVTLFEPGEIGGGCRTLTEEHAGEPVVRELGPDSFLSKPPDLVRFCERVGIADDLIGTNETPRGALVWRAGRTQRVPAGFTLLAPSEWGPTVRSPVLSPLHRVRLLTEPLRRRGISEDESIGDFVRRRLGRGVLDRLAQPLAAGIYAGDVDRLSLRACLPQFAADEAARGRVTGRRSRPRRRRAGRGRRPVLAVRDAPRRRRGDHRGGGRACCRPPPSTAGSCGASGRRGTGGRSPRRSPRTGRATRRAGTPR